MVEISKQLQQGQYPSRTSPRGTHQIGSRIVTVVAITTTRNRVLPLANHNLPNNQRSHKRRRPSSFILLAYLFPAALTTTSQETSTTTTFNVSSTETLLHDNNTVEQQCWTLTTTSFVPRTEPVAPTTQPRQRTPPVMSWPSWKPCHPHRINGWSFWNTSRPRRLCGRMVLLVGVETAKFVYLFLVCCEIARPSGSRITLIGWSVGLSDLCCTHHNAVPGVHQTPVSNVLTIHVCSFCGHPSPYLEETLLLFVVVLVWTMGRFGNGNKSSRVSGMVDAFPLSSSSS